MSRILARSFLQADLATASSLLARMGTDDLHLLDRMGLESRINDIKMELDSLEGRVGKTGEAILFFYGQPVIEEHGIDARFSAEALGAYQDLVSKQVAALLGPVGRSGPIRAERDSHLHITNVVHGSFGFELEEITADDALAEPTPLARAIEGVTSLIGAVKESDEAFADVVAVTDGRVYDALGEFLRVIYKAGATFRVVSETAEVSFREDDLASATERASARRSEVADLPVAGTFLGVLLDSRRFEHRVEETGEVLRGKVSDDVSLRDVLPWVEKPCVAHLQVVTLAGGAREQRRYTLLKLTERVLK